MATTKEARSLSRCETIFPNRPPLQLDQIYFEVG